jgi:hypothetical protein
LQLELGDGDTDANIAESVGDVLWPILSPDLRLAVRDALIAQLDQIQLDRGESALGRGDDPLDYQISIVAHSLGCFHTYEVLTAVANEPTHQLRPASDLVTFDSVILMAWPVQLISTVAGTVGAAVPGRESLATLRQPPAIPSETRRGKVIRCTQDFIFITGSHDPAGGHPPWLEARLGVPGHSRPAQHRRFASRRIGSVAGVRLRVRAAVLPLWKRSVSPVPSACSFRATSHSAC